MVRDLLTLLSCGLSVLEHLRCIFFVVRSGQLALVAIRELVQSLNADVELRRTIEFREIRDQQFRLLQLLLQRLKVDHFWHFNLCVESPALVLAPI